MEKVWTLAFLWTIKALQDECQHLSPGGNTNRNTAECFIVNNHRPKLLSHHINRSLFLQTTLSLSMIEINRYKQHRVFQCKITAVSDSSEVKHTNAKRKYIYLQRWTKREDGDGRSESGGRWVVIAERWLSLQPGVQLLAFPQCRSHKGLRLSLHPAW